ncbi:MAG: Na+/H+ antiporter subunit E [Oscillospiraceae bacterium]|nr:Na+/H+ antiporter subunit E [Oscillospiraceae bacterium]
MRKTKVPAVVAAFVVCFAFWLLLTWSVDVQELIAGAVVSLAAALFSARFFIHEQAFWFLNPAKLFTGLFYWVCIFPGELIKANVHMAKLVLSGCKDVRPGIVKIPTGLKSAYGQAALANSITLTPGTITMEIAEEEGQTNYYVHWIEADADGAEAGEAIKGRMEKWIRRFWEK